MKRSLLFFFILILTASVASAQTATYKTTRLAPVQKAATVDFKQLGPDYAPVIEYLAPSPGGESYRAFLEEQKKETARRFPRQEQAPEMRGGGAEPPILLTEFAGNNSTSSRPLDNHLAISNGNQVVSVINSHFAVKDPDGSWIGAATLDNLTSDLNIDNFKFDPRITYDLEEDKFIMVALSGNTTSTSNVIVGFSQTNDADGMWNFYSFGGDPLNTITWSDYPMIAETDTELILTLNSIKNGEPWQTGFLETLIFQIGKSEGYTGEPLQIKIWSDIGFGGQSIRNLRPVKEALGQPTDNIYFLSNRNFDVENDTIFLLELTGSMDDPNAEVLVDVLQADPAYGVPPNAIQEVGELATNDARILDAILIGDQIQFVGNSVDFNTGQAAIYHGIIDNVSTTRDISGYIVNGGDDDIGYPSLGYTGIDPGDEDVIISFSHTSLTRFPGCSAIYFSNDRIHSLPTTIKEGNNWIDMGLEPDRWGDYSGNQRKYDEPGIVWVASSFGESNKDNDTWIGSLARPDLNVNTQEADLNNFRVTTYPNPASERVFVEYEINDVEQVQILLTDQQGRIIRTFQNDRPKKEGKTRFSFATDPLATGIYYLSVIADTETIASRKIVIE